MSRAASAGSLQVIDEDFIRREVSRIRARSQSLRLSANDLFNQRNNTQIAIGHSSDCLNENTGHNESTCTSGIKVAKAIDEDKASLSGSIGFAEYA